MAMDFEYLIDKPGWRSIGGDCYAVVCEGNVDLLNKRLTGRKGYITGPLGAAEDIFYKGGQWGTIRGMILDAGCQLTVYSENNKTGISRIYKAPLDNRILIDFISEFGQPVKSIFDTKIYGVDDTISVTVEIGEIFSNMPICRINSSNGYIYGGTYGVNEAEPRVFYTSNGLNWNKSNIRPGSCESCHSIIPIENGSGIHIGTERCNGRVFDVYDADPNRSNIIIDGSKNMYVLGGGNTKDFGQLIGLSSLSNENGELWTYNNGWKKSSLPKVKNPINGDSRLIWSLCQYNDWLIIGTSWGGSNWNHPNAGEILAFKNGMTDFIVKNANVGGFVKCVTEFNGVLYASYGNMFSFTDDNNLNNWTTIKAPGVANYNIVPIDDRYLMGVWYTGRRFSNLFNEPIGVVLAMFDTEKKSFDIVHNFNINDDPEGDCYSVGGGICKLNGSIYGVINHRQSARGIKISIN